MMSPKCKEGLTVTFGLVGVLALYAFAGTLDFDETQRLERTRQEDEAALVALLRVERSQRQELWCLPSRLDTQTVRYAWVDETKKLRLDCIEHTGASAWGAQPAPRASRKPVKEKRS